MEAQSGNAAPTTSDDLPQDEPADNQDQDTNWDENLSAIDRQYASTSASIPRRIHIIGTGSIGKLVAHSLRGIANAPPITLIFHRYKLLEAWEQSKKVITIQDDGHDVPRDGYEVELMREVKREHGVELEEGGPSVYDVANEDVKPHEVAQAMEERKKEQQTEQTEQYTPMRPTSSTQRKRSLPGDYAVSSDPIHNLIVTTKAARTIPAISAIRHRISATSTICFLQNGMGIIDDVNKHIFTDPASRPNYVQGIITHGAFVPPQKAEQDPFYAVHAGHGTIALGLLPREGVSSSKDTSSDGDGKASTKTETQTETEKWAPSSRYLLRTLTRSPVLCAVGFTPTELLQQQLEKLAVNSILNPLTSLFDNRNAAFLYNFAFTRTMRLLLAETSHVITSLPELQNVPNIKFRFSPARLETLVVGVAEKTKDNISSMLADVRAGRKTEIEYINGYIVRRGEEMGVKCVVNYAIMQVVIGKSVMTQRESHDEVPTEGPRGVNRE